MKKYIKPNIEMLDAECVQMTAVSIIDDGKADDSKVMTRENDDWRIWEE